MVKTTGTQAWEQKVLILAYGIMYLHLLRSLFSSYVQTFVNFNKRFEVFKVFMGHKIFRPT
jgi:hypothetical protein